MSLWRALRGAGVLGINERNARYLQRYNRRALFPLVDDKLKTKSLALAAGISVPELYGTVAYQHDVRNLEGILAPYQTFVVKPACGSGGEGVVVVSGRSPHGGFVTIDGAHIELAALRHHVSNILGGMFSLGGRSDKAMIEYRVEFDPLFAPIVYLGVPDIRIIVFLGVPVMAMVRLPTRQSKGKANLHQGAIGAGICMRTGRTLKAVWRTNVISEHPDTGHPVFGVQVPCWQKLLELAASCYELTGLGFQGVDIVLDKVRGPLILELNARPGLNIQLANQCGLGRRLERVESVGAQGCKDRVDFCMKEFGVSQL